MSGESILSLDSEGLRPPPRRRWCWFALVAAVVGLGVGLGIGFWPRTLVPQPPEADLAEIDPEVAESIAEAQAKVRQRPNNGAIWGQLGMVFFVHDFHDQAQSSFAQAERLAPADARWPYLHGLSLIRTDPEAGIACLRRAAELCGKNSLTPRMRLVETLLNQGRLDEAERHLEWARKAEPNNARVQLCLGRFAALRGQWSAALERLGPCTNDAHTRQIAHALRAQVWTRLDQPDKAGAEQRQAERGPQDQAWPDPFVEDVLRLQRGLSVRLYRADELFTQRHYSEAVRLLEETIRRYPHATAARLHLGEFWRRLRQGEKAEQVLAEAVRADPDSAEAWFRLGCLQAERNQPRAAAESFRRTIRLKADDADAHVDLGLCLKEVGDADKAADEFHAALRCRPDYERAQQALNEMEKKK